MPRELLWTIVFCLVVAVAGLVHALKQHPPYAPQINTEQQAHSALKGEENAKPGSPSAAKANEEHGGKHAEKGEEEGTEFWPPFLGLRLKITDSLLAIFTRGLLIFTGLLWRSTDKLWAAGERQLALLSDTNQRQLRAYVSVGGIARTKDPGELKGAGFAVLVEVKNDGQTPAYDLVQWAKIEVREFPLIGGMAIHCLENPGFGVIPPHTKTMAFPTFKRDLSPLEEQAVLENGKAIYVYGEVSYRDAFDRKHLTQFRYRCNGQGYGLGLFKADAEGNDTT